MSDERNTITGTSGNDDLIGTSGNDLIKPKDGVDFVYGFDGDDWINAYVNDEGENRYYNSTGTLTAYGNDGNDLIGGKSGADILYGGDGNDRIYGRDGNDSLSGGLGDDTLDGGTGDDKLYGYDGNDTLDGGTGFDYLWGGDGDDTYIINSRIFYLWDRGGNDTAIVNIDFAKIPSTIENVTYSDGVRALPYWVSALLPETAANLSSLLGAEKTYYFGFPTAVDDYGYENDEKYEDGWQAFSDEQKAGVRVIFTNIETIIDVSFSETTKFDQLNTLTFANNIQENAGGYATYPGTYFSASDVYIGLAANNEVRVPQNDDNWHADLFVHEIGHAIGLKHPFDEPGTSGDMGPPPYLQGDEDNALWTQMAYTGSVKKLEFSPLDIAALQYLYGPNPSSRAGNDTYTFDAANANFIWDGSGTDTIDASGAEEKVTVYLEPGYWGFKGEAKAETITSNGQITVNFGTKIENLIGSNFDDHLVGNELNNLITGGGGSDSLDGGGGSDSLDGAEGIDTAVYTVNFDGASLGNFVDYGSSGGTIQLGTAWNIVSGNETDTLHNIERLKFNDKRIALDLDDHAGQTVKLLGLLLGKDQATNKTYVGTGLKLLDDGMTYEQLMSAGLDVVLGANASSLSVVELIWNNLIGPPTPADNISQYSALVDNGTYTSAGLAIVAADHSLNTTAIDLVGLAQTGVEYILYG